MTRLPLADYKTMDGILIRLGFVAMRQKGSHVFYRHLDGRSTILPNHPGRDIPRPLLRAILREIELSPEEYIRELNCK
jgi:predicted RNA binding protein YcfA (HicA-like mRNA interferase family)